MAVKQFPQDFPDITATANKVIGSKPDGTPGSVTVTPGGESFQSVTERSGRTDIFIKICGVKSPSPGDGLELYWDGVSAFIQSYGRGTTNDLQPLTFSGSKFYFQNGNAGFGTDAPQQKVHVIGNILATGSITPGSDKRLKKYIKNLPDDALGLINKLRPVSYTLKEDSATALGFIADEVRDIFPDLVLEGTDKEKLLAMNYMGLTAPMVKAIQELHASHTELQGKYNDLLSRVEALEAK